VTGDGNIALQTVQDPWAYLAVLALGVIAFGLRALVKGDLRTGREAEVLQKRAETAEGATRIRDEQVDAALRVLPQVAEVLEKFHAAGEQVRQGNAARDERPTEDDPG
jgi:hypothetical protein